jgi:hypothetical protein
MIATGFFYVVSTPAKPARKVFLIKEHFVKLPAQPHSEPLREHHERDNIRTSHAVKRFLFIYFQPHKTGQSRNHAIL